MGPQIGGYITPGQLLLSDPDVRANTGNGDTWSIPADVNKEVAGPVIAD